MNDDTIKNQYLNFIESSTYYKTTLHKPSCKICKLPPKIRLKINELLLSGQDYKSIRAVLFGYDPNTFCDESNTNKSLKAHAEYLPLLLEDALVKKMFTRARHLIDNKDLNTMSENEKAKVINDIEVEMMKEWETHEHERNSLVNMMYKETLPLLMTRLHNTIIGGKATDVEKLTKSSETILKITSVLANAQVMTDLSNNEDEENKEVTPDLKKDVISLADRIKKATGTM